MTFSKRAAFGGVAGLFLVAAFIFIFWPRSDPGGAEGAVELASNARATPVIVEKVRFRPERTLIEAVGTSRALRSVMIFPAVSGEVTSVSFAPGQAVEAGQVLVELEKREEELAVDLAELRVQDAERLLARYERTRGSGAVSATTVDAARTALEEARISLGRAQVALDYRTIRAPFAGYTGLTDVDEGDRIGPDTAITTLDDRSSLLVRFNVPELFIGRLREGVPITVATWLGGGEQEEGTIIDVGSRIDPETRTFVAQARVANEEDTLRPGMSFRVAVALQGRLYAAVPEVSVQWGGDGAYVWVVREGRAERVGVVVVQRQQGEVLVDGALDKGDVVVREGVQRMRDGLDVSYRDGEAIARDETNGAPTAEQQL